MRGLYKLRLWTILARVLSILGASFLGLLAQAEAQTNWQKRWEEIVAAAKKEGTVVVTMSSMGADTRPLLTEAFMKQFGLKLELMGLPGADAAALVEREGQAGRTSVDVMVGGADEVLSLLPAGRLDPLRDKLILPDVVDVTKWRKKMLKFNDPEQRYLLQSSEYLPTDLIVNSSLAKPGSITSWKELLKPAYKDKMASFDPRRAGAGLSSASYLLEKFGAEFVKNLYIGQQVTYTADERQLVEWIGRGAYAVGLGTGSRQVEAVRKFGLPVERVFPADGPGYLTGGPSVLKLVKNAPHPNAAQVFLNWFLTKEAQEIYQRTVSTVSRRADVDMTGIPDYVIPKEGVNYMDTYTYEFIKESRPKLRKLLGELLGR